MVNRILDSESLVKEIIKFNIKNKELLNQSFFKPYPEELTAKAEDGRGRDYWK